jgi:hypothetical protein
MVGMTAQTFLLSASCCKPPPSSSPLVCVNKLKEVFISKFDHAVIITNIHMNERLEKNRGSMTAGGVGCEYMGLLSVASVERAFV